MLIFFEERAIKQIVAMLSFLNLYAAKSLNSRMLMIFLTALCGMPCHSLSIKKRSCCVLLDCRSSTFGAPSIIMMMPVNNLYLTDGKKPKPAQPLSTCIIEIFAGISAPKRLVQPAPAVMSPSQFTDMNDTAHIVNMLPVRLEHDARKLRDHNKNL